MGNVFGEEKPLKDIIRENQRMIKKSIRELEKEIKSLESNQKKLEADIKKHAKMGQMVRVYVNYPLYICVAKECIYRRVLFASWPKTMFEQRTTSRSL